MYGRHCTMKINKLIGVSAAACLALVGFVGCNAISANQNTNGRNDDEVLSAKVRASISGDPSLRQDNIVVTTTDGVVVLTGSAVSAVDRRRAVALANLVPGVQSVDNSIAVK